MRANTRPTIAVQSYTSMRSTIAVEFAMSENSTVSGHRSLAPRGA
jgi:hypothetical protein